MSRTFVVPIRKHDFGGELGSVAAIQDNLGEWYVLVDADFTATAQATRDMRAVGDTCSNLAIAAKWQDTNRIDVPSGFKTVQVTNAVVSSCSTEDSMFSVTCRVGNLTFLSEENELGGNYWRIPDGD